MCRHPLRPLLGTVLWLLSTSALAQSPRVLYTWEGSGDVRGWFKNFGANDVTLENTTPGELTVTETGAPGAGVAVSDDFNRVREARSGLGGLDLTGLSALEFDLGHDGAGPVGVQFFVQASPASTFVALGPDQAVAPGVNTYSAPVFQLGAGEIAYIRTIGVNIRDHAGEGNLVWTLREVRSAGTPRTQRVYASHEASSSDGGLQGAIVNFENGAVEGNDGGQNQSGLRHNTSAPPNGNTGSLEWTDLAAGDGAAVSYGNGTLFAGNTFNERPTDMSNYRFVVLRMAARNAGGNVPSVDVQYFLQTNGFNFHAAGPDQTLPADGAFHDLAFPIDAVPDLDFVEQHGVNLRSHPGGDLIVDIDELAASSHAPPRFTLAFSGPSSLTGAQGTMLEIEHVCTLEHEGPGPGAEIYIFGVRLECNFCLQDPFLAPHPRITEITLEGTDAGAFRPPFIISEVLEDGRAAAVVVPLSTNPGFAFLPPNGVSSVLRIRWAASLGPSFLAPEEGDGGGAKVVIQIPVTFRYVDDLVIRRAPDAPDIPIPIAAWEEGLKLSPQTEAFDVLLTGLPPAFDFQKPGDCNQDGQLDISDGICLLGHLFLNRPPVLPCEGGTTTDLGNLELLDHNGDMAIDISDAVGVFSFLFLGGLPPIRGRDCVQIRGCPTVCP